LLLSAGPEDGEKNLLQEDAQLQEIVRQEIAKLEDRLRDSLSKELSSRLLLLLQEQNPQQLDSSNPGVPEEGSGRRRDGSEARILFERADTLLYELEDRVIELEEFQQNTLKCVGKDSNADDLYLEGCVYSNRRATGTSRDCIQLF